MLEIFDGLAGKRAFRSGSVVGAVIRKLNIGDVEMSLGRMVRIGGEFVPEFHGANVGCILITHAMLIEGLVRDGEREVARIGQMFAHGKGVLAELRL